MQKFVDIHHHLIYGVDDGPQTIEDMQKMLLRAAQENVGHIVCTAHVTPGGQEFPADVYIEHMEQARQWCRQEGLELQLHNGCEVLYTDFSAHLLRQGRFPSLANTWNVLVEFPPNVDFRRLCDAASSMGNAGFKTIFAHVERYQALRNLDYVKELREEYGVYMQMNASTVVNRKGFFFERWVRHMLDEGHIDCVATDAHNITSRPCSMRICYEMLSQRYGQSVAEKMCGGFQRTLLGLRD